MITADKQDVICLIAPTASGKTALAYELYETGKYRLISVDSALIYRDMNIGTAKPTREELAHYPHALVDIISPEQSYSVAQFVSDVDYHINLAHQQNKTPVLVGGTMMYYMALIQGINDIPATLPEIRQQVTQLIAEQGVEQLHAYLTQVDPILAKQLKTTDTQRIGRAVEIYLQTGKPLSAWQNQPARALADNPHQRWQILAVMPDRDWLHKRIALRLDIMWQQGFLQEVIALRQRYHLTADLPSMRCVGYRQAWDFLEKIQNTTLFTYDNNKENFHDDVARFLLNTHSSPIQDYRQTMQNEALYATRQLAKRQYTWMRKLVSTQQLVERFDIRPLATIDQARNLLIKTS
ncbi:tRNA (adenosine(37)-N6)-dimethylallyltransferase MiaA [Moraxella osloensis]|nr:tRNA (adenosine(37)-N6)-dimethylallyltransferase MiaA [Moraxella osloensis]PAL17834.1 tRNA (adenosine(37)-N6)-dimethylallyltransferase MiaA [Moraxella osloensis]